MSVKRKTKSRENLCIHVSWALQFTGFAFAIFC